LIGTLGYEGQIRWIPGARIGYVPQKLDIERDLPLSGREFLQARAALAKASTEQLRQAVEAVALTEAILKQPLGTLSGGQFQRLLVAFALLGRPNVLLLDEPAAGVDAPGQVQLSEVLRQLQSTERLTIVLVSHDLSVVSDG
jgi:zinc transport system ATP-binding protein